MLPNKYRPFDCESWPFYVMKSGDKIVITKSKDCPIFNKIDDKVLINFIEKKFLKITQKIVKDNPSMITKYNRGLKILYEFNIDE